VAARPGASVHPTNVWGRGPLKEELGKRVVRSGGPKATFRLDVGPAECEHLVVGAKPDLRPLDLGEGGECILRVAMSREKEPTLVPLSHDDLDEVGDLGLTNVVSRTPVLDFDGICLIGFLVAQAKDYVFAPILCRRCEFSLEPELAKHRRQHSLNVAPFQLIQLCRVLSDCASKFARNSRDRAGDSGALRFSRPDQSTDPTEQFRKLDELHIDREVATNGRRRVGRESRPRNDYEAIQLGFSRRTDQLIKNWAADGTRRFVVLVFNPGCRRSKMLLIYRGEVRDVARCPQRSKLIPVDGEQVAEDRLNLVFGLFRTKRAGRPDESGDAPLEIVKVDVMSVGSRRDAAPPLRANRLPSRRIVVSNLRR
jgi:hypothetical protein